MRAKPVLPRELANRDVDEAIAHYLGEGSAEIALGFVDALESACEHIGRHPLTGSPRYAHEPDLPGLRTWSLERYPYLVFFIARGDHIDVWRVLHAQRGQSDNAGRAPNAERGHLVAGVPDRDVAPRSSYSG